MQLQLQAEAEWDFLRAHGGPVYRWAQHHLSGVPSQAVAQHCLATGCQALSIPAKVATAVC